MSGPDVFWDYLPWLGMVLALGCLVGAYRSGSRRRLVDNLPTSKTTGVFIGLVELKGRAEAEQPLTSYLAERACVQYEWSIEEHWSRTVTETYRDSQGRLQTRTRTESGWKNVAGGNESIPFYLRDDCGVVLVRPEKARLENVTLFERTCGRLDSLYYGKGPAGAVAHSSHRRRFRESGLPLHVPLYVLGQARERTDLVAPEIAHDPQAPMFLISTRSEAQVSRRFGLGQWVWGVTGLVVLVGSLVGRDVGLGLEPALRLPFHLLGVGLYLGASALGWLWMSYNSLVDLQNRVRQAWSLVEVQLKRRHELIPNLVSAVQRFQEHERETQTELAALRAQLNATPPGISGPDYAAVQPRLDILVERYPELKANTLFLGLQENLSDTEHRIALARGYFNEIATHYNTRLEVVPERFVARLARLKPQPLMAANDFEREPVAVQLAD